MIFTGDSETVESMARKVYEGHCGNPGHRGGSRPKSECGSGPSKADDDPVSDIARRYLRVDSLEEKKSDREDFKEFGVSSARDAIRAAAKRGKRRLTDKQIDRLVERMGFEHPVERGQDSLDFTQVHVSTIRDVLTEASNGSARAKKLDDLLAQKGYPNHCGNPGHRGGSRPKSECGVGGDASDKPVQVVEMEDGPKGYAQYRIYEILGGKRRKTDQVFETSDDANGIAEAANLKNGISFMKAIEVERDFNSKGKRRRAKKLGAVDRLDALLARRGL